MPFSSESGKKTCYCVRLEGCVDYNKALSLQMKLCDLKKAGFAHDFLLLLEHEPVITLGRNGKWLNLVVSEEILKGRGVQRTQSDRGGDITFHGPGQLVGYPILKLERHEQDVHRYMRNLEEMMIRVAADFGICAGREEKLTGVWTDAGKICAMGVHISRWITRHGFALNVNVDLSYYELIVPCGIVGRPVASMQSILGHRIDFGAVTESLIAHFGQVFSRHIESMNPEDLGAL